MQLVPCKKVHQTFIATKANNRCCSGDTYQDEQVIVEERYTEKHRSRDTT